MFAARTTHSHNTHQIPPTPTSSFPFCPHTQPCPLVSTVRSCPLWGCLTSRRRDRLHSSLPACMQHTREIHICLLALLAFVCTPSAASCPVPFLCRHSSSAAAGNEHSRFGLFAVRALTWQVHIGTFVDPEAIGQFWSDGGWCGWVRDLLG